MKNWAEYKHRTPIMTELDVLEKQLETATGREKVDILIEIGKSLYLKEPERIKELIEEAYRLSIDLDYPIGKANSLRIKGNLFWVAGDYNNAMDHYQSAKKVYERLDDIENLTLVTKAIARTYINYNDLGNSLRHYHMALEYAKQSGNKKNQSACNNGLGFAYYHKHDLESSLKYFQNALVINEAIGDLTETAISYNNIADICHMMGNREQALDFAHRAIDCLKKTDMDNAGYACEFYITLGDIYKDMEDYENAIQYYNKSLKQGWKISYKEGMILVHMKIGLLHQKLNRLGDAEEYLTTAYHLAKETGNEKEEKECLDHLNALKQQMQNVK